MSEVRIAAQKVREWTERRNEAIRAALASGKSSREVAADAGLSHVAVQKIAKR